mmetsp:Transcript_10080/g.28699  ORF Transcript_10080/g.28699 Transcript_10080/m.28699 type:complete len:216 (+) Transcript_10080:50-697(+)
MTTETFVDHRRRDVEDAAESSGLPVRGSSKVIDLRKRAATSTSSSSSQHQFDHHAGADKKFVAAKKNMSTSRQWILCIIAVMMMKHFSSFYASFFEKSVSEASSPIPPLSPDEIRTMVIDILVPILAGPPSFITSNKFFNDTNAIPYRVLEWMTSAGDNETKTILESSNDVEHRNRNFFWNTIVLSIFMFTMSIDIGAMALMLRFVIALLSRRLR